MEEVLEGVRSIFVSIFPPFVANALIPYVAIINCCNGRLPRTSCLDRLQHNCVHYVHKCVRENQVLYTSTRAVIVASLCSGSWNMQDKVPPD